MSIDQAYSLSECISLASGGSPIHCSAPQEYICFMSQDDYNTILLDFYGQNPLHAPANVVNYLSVLGDYQTAECLSRYWGITNTIKTLDISSWDVTEFCNIMGQDVNNVNVVCSDTLEGYLSTK